MPHGHEYAIPVVTPEIIEAGMRRARRERSIAFYDAMGMVRAALARLFGGRDRRSRGAEASHGAIGHGCRQVL